jgi:DNA cross-link repair 1A protein
MGLQKDSPVPGKPRSGKQTRSLSAIDFFLPRAAKNQISCPICELDITGLELAARTRHVGSCLGEEDVSLAPETRATPEQSVMSPAKTDGNGITVGQQMEWEERMAEGTTTAGELIMSKEMKVQEVNEEVQIQEIADASQPTLEEDLTTTAGQDSSSNGVPMKKLPSGRPRTYPAMPFFKVLELDDVKFAVDAFNFGSIPGVSKYFLTHFHSDHYQGLSGSWRWGEVYCSEVTARLVQLHLKVDPDIIRTIPMNTAVYVDNIKVHFIDANHCPGSVLILFESPSGKSILHTGDFRACEAHVNLFNTVFCQTIDILYLDTTYLEPSHSFPAQDAVIRICGDYCVNLRNSGTIPSKERTILSFFPTLNTRKFNPVVFVGSYTIGKERLAVHIADRMDSKIFAQRNKQKTLKALEDSDLNERLCDNGWECNVHIVSMREVQSQELALQWQILRKKFTHLLAFQPTGWNFRAKKGDVPKDELGRPLFTMDDLENCRKMTGNIHIFRVPYSEHSSFSELEYFCRNVKSHRIIPTVNTGSVASRERMNFWLNKWK